MGASKAADLSQQTLPGHFAPDPGDVYLTEVAGMCKDLADSFNARVTSASGWRIEMTRPGLSTFRGSAPQNMVLRGPGRRPIVIGTVNVSVSRAQFRWYHDVSERNRQRTGVPIPITVADFDKVVNGACALLEQASISVSPVNGRPLGPAPSLHPTFQLPSWAGVLFGATVVATTTVVLGFLASLVN